MPAQKTQADSPVAKAFLKSKEAITKTQKAVVSTARRMLSSTTRRQQTLQGALEPTSLSLERRSLPARLTTEFRLEPAEGVRQDPMEAGIAEEGDTMEHEEQGTLPETRLVVTPKHQPMVRYQHVADTADGEDRSGGNVLIVRSQGNIPQTGTHIDGNSPARSRETPPDNHTTAHPLMFPAEVLQNADPVILYMIKMMERLQTSQERLQTSVDTGNKVAETQFSGFASRMADLQVTAEGAVKSVEALTLRTAEAFQDQTDTMNTVIKGMAVCEKDIENNSAAIQNLYSAQQTTDSILEQRLEVLDRTNRKQIENDIMITIPNTLGAAQKDSQGCRDGGDVRSRTGNYVGGTTRYRVQDPGKKVTKASCRPTADVETWGSV